MYNKEEAISKINKIVYREGQLKLIWGWIKVGYISFSQFEELLEYVRNNEEIDTWE